MKSVKFPFYFYIIPILMVATGIIILCTSLRDINTVVVLVTGIALVASSFNSIMEYIGTRNAVVKSDEV